MYTAILFVHSWMRWVVLVLALVAIGRALSGAFARRPWTTADTKAGRFFTIALDVQVLLGLVLYFPLSPITRAALEDFGGAMASSGLRYWAVEHVFGMIVGLVLAHRGISRVRSIADPVRKHRVAAVFLILALVVILVSIPWPGTPNARPLFRL